MGSGRIWPIIDELSTQTRGGHEYWATRVRCDRHPALLTHPRDYSLKLDPDALNRIEDTDSIGRGQQTRDVSPQLAADACRSVEQTAPLGQRWAVCDGATLTALRQMPTTRAGDAADQDMTRP
jgi:hypothetical protein